MAKGILGAGSIDVTTDVSTLEEAQREIERMAADLEGTPMLEAMRNATLMVQRSAKKNLKAWEGPGTGGVDTGRLRASIVPEIRTMTGTLQGVVGSNVKYSIYQELGTRPHFVPAKYIGKWAERHGLGFRGVFVTGKPLKYLRRALDDNADKIRRLFERFISGVIHK